MTWHEFCDNIVATVLELQNECKGVDETEFNDFKDRTLEEVSSSVDDFCLRFMDDVFEMIRHNVFSKEIENQII